MLLAVRPRYTAFFVEYRYGRARSRASNASLSLLRTAVENP